MAKAPVYYAIAQVQHNPLLSLSSYLPQIQESMRIAGYPDFSQGLQFGINITANIASPESANTQVTPPQSVVKPIDSYQFKNIERTDGFVMLPNAFSFQTTEYDTFKSFSEKFEKGLEILVNAIGGLSFVERVGLRYLDAIVPQADDNFRDYLAKEMLGLPALMEERTFAYSFTEANLVIPDGQVVARTIMQNGALGFPPDLQLQSLKVGARFTGLSGEHATLDTDGSISKRTAFNADEMKQTLRTLHGYVSECFEAMTTDHARRAWKQ